MAEKFVSFEKLSKKKQAELNKKKRKKWDVNPTTKIVPDKTKYSRAQFKRFSED